MRDARKLFRLFKSINEAKKIKDLTNGVLDVNLGLNILIRAFFLLYWFFDNLNILSKIKLLDFDPKKMAKIGSTFWLIALVTNLVLLVRNLLANLKKCSDLKKYQKPLSQDLLFLRLLGADHRTQERIQSRSPGPQRHLPKHPEGRRRRDPSRPRVLILPERLGRNRK